MVVERRGGTVSLKAVEQAIQKIQIGTDKTAAELAMVRLKEEFHAKEKEVTSLRIATSPIPMHGCLGFVLIIICGLFFASAAAPAGGNAGGICVLLFFAFGASFFIWRVADVRKQWRAEHPTKLANVEREYEDLKRRIAENQTIAES